MLKKFKNIGFMNLLALAMVVATANSACVWYFHQPEFPEEANCMRKKFDD